MGEAAAEDGQQAEVDAGPWMMALVRDPFLADTARVSGRAAVGNWWQWEEVEMLLLLLPTGWQSYHSHQSNSVKRMGKQLLPACLQSLVVAAAAVSSPWTS